MPCSFPISALRRAGASLLPDYDVVILDEAHTLEAVAGEHLGLSLTSGQFDYLLSKLYNDRTQRGLLGPSQAGRRDEAGRPGALRRPLAVRGHSRLAAAVTERRTAGCVQPWKSRTKSRPFWSTWQ